MVTIAPAVDALLEGLPEVRDRLHRVGVPSTFTPGPRMYAAEPDLTVVHDESGKPLVRFGSSGPLDDAICIDPTTGTVWVVGAMDAEAVVPDRFWSTFLDDVTIGDFPPR